MSNLRHIYMNRMQQSIFYGGARDQRVLASRRFGKTDGVIGPQCGRVSMSMARGAGLWVGNSRKQLLTRSAPATISAMERFFGWRVGEHLFWGQPPKSLDLPKPIITPKEWSNCVTVANGFVWYLISLAVTGSANGLTSNFCIWDEAKFGNKSKFDAEVGPCMSGITHPMGDPSFSDFNPYYKGTLFVSDAALSQRDNWMEKEEAKCDEPITLGPFAGRTPRQLQVELDEYAETVIFFNNLLYWAKKNNKEIVTVSEEKKEEIELLVAACKKKEGLFKILPQPGTNKQNIAILTNYNVITPEDAHLLYNHEYLITYEDQLRYNRITSNSKLAQKYRDHIRQLRCYGFSYYRADSIDNIELLGERYIADMKRDLPPIVFAISILNLKKVKSSDGFYSNLDIENIHGYYPAECPAFEGSIKKQVASQIIGGQRISSEYEAPDFDVLQSIKNCTLDGDVHPEEPLHIAFDWNANINWVVTAQVYHDPIVARESMMVLSSMFTKNERKLRGLCDDWCRYYRPHQLKNRKVNFYFDNTAKFGDYAVEGRTDFKDIVIQILTQNGWEVNPIDMGRAPRHEQKHLEINESLAGASHPFIRFNRDNNEALILAMEHAEVEVGYKGFRKNKAGEKLAETEDNPLEGELRTDSTDAFDSLYHGIRHYRNAMPFVCLPSGGFSLG